MAHVIDQGAAPTKEMLGGRGVVRQLVGPDVGSQRLDVHINVIAEGTARGPYHHHTNAENVFLVLEGIAELVIEGQVMTAGPGVAVWIAPNERHSVRNSGMGDLKVLEIRAPADADFVIDEGS